MDEATQQNAAMVEETSAAARNLATEVNGLSEHAAKFNVGSPAGAAHRSSQARFSGSVKQLPTAAVARLVRPAADADEWQSF
jgi:methyl-accepting chemotaxis protein